MSEAGGGTVEGDAAHVAVDTPGLDAETAERFTEAARSAAAVFAGVAQNYGVELPDLRLIGTLDFQATVDDLLRQVHGPGQPTYTTERLGGTAVGKNIALNVDHSKVAVVMFAGPWMPGAEARGLAVGISLLAHELAHSVLERLRVASGSLEGVTFPSTAPRPAARSITRIAVDELRADRIADIVLSLSATKTVDGKGQPLHLSDQELFGSPYRDQLAELLVTRVYPGWRDSVNEYRNWGITLEELMRRLVSEADQMMTAIAHAQAEALSTPEDGVLFVPTAAGEPGATWLMGPVWEAVMTVAAQHPFIPELAQFKAAELAILDVGERELFAMWERLGITFDPPRPDSHPYEIRVAEPKQPP